MKNRLKLLTAFSVFLALTVAVIAASQDSPAKKGGRAGAPAAAKPAAVNVKRPFAPAGGGDTCGTATAMASLPFNDSGNTTGAADDVNTVSPGCGTAYVQTAGPDLIYSFTVGAGNSLTFTLTPTTGWDPKIYILGTCGSGATCIGGADAFANGGAETLAVSGLTPGTYFFYVDSFYSAGPDPAMAQGPYDLAVSGSFGALPPTNTPTVTNTPVVTNTPTNTPTLTNTPTNTPTVTNTSVAPTNTPTVTPTFTNTSVVPTSTPTSTPTFTATIVVSTSTPTPTTTSGGGGPGNGPSSPVPTLSTWMLALFAVALAGSALFLTRRS